MDESSTQELHTLFAQPLSSELTPDILGELQSIKRLHSISPQELFYKWESYSIKMGSEETRLDLDTVRAFKKDVQDSLERGLQGKANLRSSEKRGPAAGGASRLISNSSDIMSMLDGLVPSTPKAPGSNESSGSTAKRKAVHESHSVPRPSKAPVTPNTERPSVAQGNADAVSSVAQSAAFSERSNSGQVLEQINDHLPVAEAPLAPPTESRIKVTAFTDLKKFSYRPMAMHLSEASEVLDDRIDELSVLVQAHHSLPDDAFGNPASQSTSEIVAVGRIASDSLDSRLNAASLVLETSRRMGAGLRIPLKLDAVPSYEFFPGQVVALRGVNAAGEYFSVKEILEIPTLPPAVSEPAMIDTHNDRLRGGSDAMEEDATQPLTILFASGPYTADDNLNFEPLRALCDQATSEVADAVVLTGPFIDLEHPLVASGDFDLPTDLNVDPDAATLTTVFRGLISPHLQRLANALPGITIILVPSVKDAISKHVAWPQEALPRKELGLPAKKTRLIPNPVTISLNELLVGLSAQDVLSELRQEETVGPKPRTPNLLGRLPKHLVEQRHFFPLFPPVSRARLLKTGVADTLPIGAMLDTSYLKLGEWLNVKPDILITPSALPVFAKVVESVLVINPGSLSKRKGPGSYARLTVHPRIVTEEERAKGDMLEHLIYKRGRVDIVRI